MIKFKRLIPSFVKQKLKQRYIRKKYSNANIHTTSIGKDVEIGLNCQISSEVNLGNNVVIGDFSYVNSNTRLGSNTKVGKFCSISYDCHIGLPEHPTNYISTHPATFGKYQVLNLFNTTFEEDKSTVIGNDVWIGGRATIIKGTIIHDGAIIAAGAVVTKDVPAYSIVGGVPAKVIKYRFDKEHIEYLNNLRWWDLSVENIKKRQQLFESKDLWLEYIKNS